ncbi:biliverdin-producing heme oxygenase [Halomonas sp. G15]|mgnify:CR=1 FL=1|uniref:biliverdin-producing heme oxygenase n=1 Tax=Halomonas sp. G15 TaxID=2903521 RepID=UPI0009DE6299|nr:biliverdin-producing heme oxygenase [Halomonas sp. G15]
MSKTRRDIARAPALLLQLRDSTRDYHHALDHHPELQRLLRPGLTLNGYRRSLLALHAPQAALEGAVAEGAMYLGQAELLSPCRLPALEADLAALGVAQTDTDISHRPSVPRSAAELLGLRYVLEGSRLGAEVIVRCLHDTLGEAAPVSFFAASQGHWHWRNFVAQLTTTRLNAQEQQRAISAAQHAFEAYRAGLEIEKPVTT